MPTCRHCGASVAVVPSGTRDPHKAKRLLVAADDQGRPLRARNAATDAILPHVWALHMCRAAPATRLREAQRQLAEYEAAQQAGDIVDHSAAIARLQERIAALS